jgi:D-glycero-D-manno-heptose 1,7-bisphosphate phosphatase
MVPSLSPNSSPEPVVFLDRDGVINRDSPAYIKSLDEFEFLPRSLSAIKKLTQSGIKTIVITNQSAVNRGLISRKTLDTIHGSMTTEVRIRGGRIDDIFFCPHTPQEGCDCRKPAPGMIYKASFKHAIDLSFTGMVGDSAKDIACARRAQVRYAVLVKTGNFAKAQQELHDLKLKPDRVALDLYTAVEWMIGQFQTLCRIH